MGEDVMEAIQGFFRLWGDP
ncbi:hypothetical protein Pint_17942 [Pistacia integerrima]|uniref:Uncharacterized protein n=1 Tax=Pistacia integerrima TaxID=434235 RepID=A0ACC0YWZ5_9ROSI|nr:hypothetical protein Pint_17942 [Pistacia integerrima]